MKNVTQTLDPLLTTVNKSQTPAKKAKWHLGKFIIYSAICTMSHHEKICYMAVCEQMQISLHIHAV